MAEFVADLVRSTWLLAFASCRQWWDGVSRKFVYSLTMLEMLSGSSLRIVLTSIGSQSFLECLRPLEFGVLGKADVEVGMNASVGA